MVVIVCDIHIGKPLTGIIILTALVYTLNHNKNLFAMTFGRFVVEPDRHAAIVILHNVILPVQLKTLLTYKAVLSGAAAKPMLEQYKLLYFYALSKAFMYNTSMVQLGMVQSQLLVALQPQHFFSSPYARILQT
jgi:hypothetical protein